MIEDMKSWLKNVPAELRIQGLDLQILSNISKLDPKIPKFENLFFLFYFFGDYQKGNFSQQK